MEDKVRYPVLAVMLVLIVVSINYLEGDQGPSEIEGVKVGGYEGYKAPELIPGGEWFNSEPLAIRNLTGKVVLVDFWTYTCVNCIHTIPFLRDWHEKYSDQGLVIIGVHSPEFGFEREPENVQAAIEELGVLWSVVQDNDFNTWRAYDNHNWPHKYLIDKNGIIRYDRIGEGGYDDTEKWIIRLLEEGGQKVERREGQAIQERDYNTATVERYLGSSRKGALGNVEGYQYGAYDYSDPGEANREDDMFYLDGEWAIDSESSVYLGEPEEGYVVIRYFSNLGRANAVMVPPAGGPVEVTVTQDGEYLTPENAGSSIKFDGARSYILVDKDNFYNIVDSEDMGRHLLKLTLDKDGLSIFTLTFV